MLDELNKYAPREGTSPIKEVLLDIAERGRSLGRDPDRRAADRQRGGAAHRDQLGDPGGRPARPGRGVPPGVRLPAAGQRQRALLAKPGTMFVNQPDIPVPLCVEFPFPAWATRLVRGRSAHRPATLRSIVQAADPFARGRRPAAARRRRHPVLGGSRMKILHTSDWHVGKVLKGQSRHEEHIAVLAEVVEIAAGRTARPGDRRRRPLRHRRADRRTPRRWSPGRCPRCGGTGAAGGGDRRQPRQRRRAGRAAPVGRRRPASPCAARSATSPTSTLITGTTAGGERWRLVALPFLSQRYAVRAAEMFELTAAEAQPDLRRPHRPADRAR